MDVDAGEWTRVDGDTVLQRGAVVRNGDSRTIVAAHVGDGCFFCVGGAALVSTEDAPWFVSASLRVDLPDVMEWRVVEPGEMFPLAALLAYRVDGVMHGFLCNAPPGALQGAMVRMPTDAGVVYAAMIRVTG